MAIKRKTPPSDYEIGKGRPPKASRWKKGQSGNPKGRVQRPPGEAELIERLFRRSFAVIEGGEKVSKTGFAIIHAQLLMKESAGHRRAGRTRDRYEAFARADEGTGSILLRYVDSEPAPNPVARPEDGDGTESRPQDVETPADPQSPRGCGASAADEPTEGKS